MSGYSNSSYSIGGQAAQDEEFTPDEVARFEAWQARREAVRREQAARLDEERNQQQRERTAKKRGMLESLLKGKRIVDVSADFKDYSDWDVRHFALMLDDGTRVELEAGWGDEREIEITWRMEAPDGA
jgi:uncharacterized protein YaiL (DUF2058 family)